MRVMPEDQKKIAALLIGRGSKPSAGMAQVVQAMSGVPSDPPVPGTLGQIDPYGVDYNAVGARAYGPQGAPMAPRETPAYDRKGPIEQEPIDPNFDGRELLTPDREGARLSPKPGDSFAPGAETRTAELDAFKMMQLAPEYGDPAVNDANSSEGRRLQLLRRAMFADAALEDPRLARAMTKLDNTVASKFGALGRLYTDDDFELGKLMAEQFSSAILRGDSGAATPDNEVARYQRQYFPLPNETPEQIAAKKAMRREEIRAMIQSLPEDARPVAMQIQQEINELKRQSDVPDGTFNQGSSNTKDPDGWTVINGVRVRVKQ